MRMMGMMAGLLSGGLGVSVAEQLEVPAVEVAAGGERRLQTGSFGGSANNCVRNCENLEACNPTETAELTMCRDTCNCVERPPPVCTCAAESKLLRQLFGAHSGCFGLGWVASSHLIWSWSEQVATCASQRAAMIRTAGARPTRTAVSRRMGATGTMPRP